MNNPFRYGKEVTGYQFYDRKEIRDFLALLRLKVNPSDQQAFQRVTGAFAQCKGLGKASVRQLIQEASDASRPLLEYIGCEESRNNLKGKSMKAMRLRRLSEWLEQIRNAPDAPVLEAVLAIDGISRFTEQLELQYGTENLATRKENMESFMGRAASFAKENPEATLAEFLEDVALVADVDSHDPEADSVVLMTLHSSKGLEFPYVFIAGMEENLFPSESMNGSLQEIEEERRLFYVAITRAMKAVTISFSQNRRKWGSEESNPPSRFIREIDSKYYSNPLFTPFDEVFHTEDSPRRGQAFPTSRKSPTPSYGSAHSVPTSVIRAAPARPAPVPKADFKPSPISELRVGQRVEHDRFGFGTIVSFDGHGPDMKAVVNFDNSAPKTLLLKFAKLRIAD